MAVSEAEKSSQPEAEVEGERVQQFGTVFYTSIAIAAAFVGAGVFFTEPFGAALTAVVGQIIASLGWMYLLITTGFLVFVLFLAFSRYGKIKLGKPDDEPEFGLFSWFAMLFQAGMGIGIIFWGVSEPVLHYIEPPLGQASARTPAAAELAHT